MAKSIWTNRQIIEFQERGITTKELPILFISDRERNTYFQKVENLSVQKEKTRRTELLQNFIQQMIFHMFKLTWIILILVIEH